MIFITEIRDDGSDSVGPAAASTRYGQQDLHYVVIDGSGAALDDKDVFASNRIRDVASNFTVRMSITSTYTSV